MSDTVILLDDDKPAPSAPAKAASTNPIVEALMARIAKPETTSQFLKVLIYGEPGVGKTSLCGSAPNTLLIDVERGSRTLVGTSVDVLEYVSFQQVDKFVDLLVADDPAFSKYDTIAFDSLSELQRRVLDSQLDVTSKTTGTKTYKASWDHYGPNTQMLRELMSRFRDVPNKNLIVTAQTKLDKDETTGITFNRPDLTPKLNATITAMFDIVGFLKINSKGERVLQVQPSKTVVAKSRITTLSKEINNPTWASFK
jgi:phage nucleotide-binding protein